MELSGNGCVVYFVALLDLGAVGASMVRHCGWSRETAWFLKICLRLLF